MPNLFKGYCYATLQEAADADVSQGDVYMYQSNGTTIYGTADAGYTVLSDHQVEMYLNAYDPNQGGVFYPGRLVKAYPLCDSVGYQHNFTGLTLADVTALSFGVVLVWAVAFGIKSMKRPILFR